VTVPVRTVPTVPTVPVRASPVRAVPVRTPMPVPLRAQPAPSAVRSATYRVQAAPPYAARAAAPFYYYAPGAPYYYGPAVPYYAQPPYYPQAAPYSAAPFAPAGYGAPYGLPVRAPESPAEPPEAYAARPGFQIGARVAFQRGFGSVYNGLAVSDVGDAAVPLVIDLGWRLLSWLYVGAYGQVAPVVTKNTSTACPTGSDCSAMDWRLGIEADFHLAPSSRLDPYVGVGTGYEILHRTIGGPISVPLGSTSKAGVADVSVTDQGWEMVALTAGLDLRTSRNIGVGPFVTGTLDRFDLHHGTQSTVLDGGNVSSGSVTAVTHTVHELLILGVRGTFTR
jgi:hypothetical protein